MSARPSNARFSSKPPAGMRYSRLGRRLSRGWNAQKKKTSMGHTGSGAGNVMAAGGMAKYLLLEHFVSPNSENKSLCGYNPQ